MPETTSLQALIMAAGMATADGTILDTPVQSDASTKSSSNSAVNLRVQLVNLLQIFNRTTSSLSLP